MKIEQDVAYFIKKNIDMCAIFQQRLKNDLENEKERCLTAQNQLSRDKMSMSSVKRDFDLEKEKRHSDETKHKTKLSDLRTALDMERARCNELNR